MTKPRRAVGITTPPKNILAPESVEQQIARFLAGGGKVQRIPEGTQSEVHQSVSRKAMNERSAQHALGGRKGSAAKRGMNYRKEPSR